MSLAWNHTFLTLSLILKLKSPGLTLYVLVLSKTAHKWYRSHPSNETHALYISACNHASDFFIPKIKILHYDIFHVLSGLDFQKAYGLDGVPPVLKNCTVSSPRMRSMQATPFTHPWKNTPFEINNLCEIH